MKTLTYDNSTTVADAKPSTRAAFIRRTYGHLAGAILFFIVIETFLVNSPNARYMTETMLGEQWSWLIVLAAFMGVTYIANKWAMMDTSPELQYLGLGLFVVAESIIFLPLLYIADNYYDGIIGMAGFMTLLLFAGLTSIVFITKKDFSFLGSILVIGGFVALGVILASIAFGFSLGIVFSGAMIVFAAGSILYDTSNMMHHYNPNQHVAASLSLFASVALLFWYIVRFLMAFFEDD